MSKLKWLTLFVAIGGSAGLAQAQGVDGSPPPQPKLSQMDGNGDGRVTVAEADAFFATMRPGREHDRADHAVGTRPQSPSGEAPPRHADDANRPPPPGGQNGQRPEGAPPQPPSGARLDTDGNGIISQAEFDVMLRSMSAPPSQ